MLYRERPDHKVLCLILNRNDLATLNPFGFRQVEETEYFISMIYDHLNKSDMGLHKVFDRYRFKRIRTLKT